MKEDQKKDDRALSLDDPDVERLRRGYVADQFFVDELPARHAPPPPKSLTVRQELRAIRAFVKSLNRMTPEGRIASLEYLVSRFVGRRRW